MLKRKMLDQLRSWRQHSKGTEAVLVEGARRVGKSTTVEEFAASDYRSYILIDFSRLPASVKEIFELQKDDLDTFFMMLSTYYRTRLYERESAIVFDEVQRYPLARELVKHLVADGRYDYIETGSLMSIKANVEGIVIPSEEVKLQMNPLDFEEFLWAMDEDLLADAIRSAFEKRAALPDPLHRRALRLWREYLLVGGMPQVVTKYIDTRDFSETDHVKRNILGLYMEDVAKFAGGDASRVRNILAQIPGQLSKHEKKFVLSSIGKNTRTREYGSAFFWLEDACVVNVCRKVTDPSVGLALTEDGDSFKCYMADTGLLVAQVFADRATTPDEVYRDILFEKLSLNEGMLVENAVAQQLLANGHRLNYFSSYAKGNAAITMEVDFLLVREYENAGFKARVSPVEVKSTKRYSTKSLDKFKTRFGKRVGTQYVLHPGQVKVEGDRACLPLYMSICL